MPQEKTEKLDGQMYRTPRISRRKWLSAALTGGISVNYLTSVVGGRGGDTVTIPVAQSGEEILATKEVPRDWWEQMVKSRDVHHSLHNRYENVAGIEDIGLTSIDETISGRRKGAVSIYVDSNVSPEPDIPDSVEGIDIVVKEMPKTKLVAECNTDADDPVPGSNLVINKFINDNGVLTHAEGTSTCRVITSENEYLMTTSHLWKCDDSPSNDRVYQGPNGGSDIGYVADYSRAQDWAVTLVDSSADVSGYTDTLEGTGLSVESHAPEQRVMDLVSSTSDFVAKYGFKTCKSTGLVEDSHLSSGVCGASNGHSVRSSCYNESGDSGSPVYEVLTDSSGNDYASIINILNVQLVVSGEIKGGKGCAAYQIYKNHGYQFN